MAFVPEEEIDHRNLPDDIIHHIFSFLPFKEVVKTSVLSKQWRFRWTSTPYIHLSIHSEDVVPLISRSLSQCTAARLKKFHIDVPMPNVRITMELEQWCCFAVARKVEDFSLVFGCGHHSVPRSLYDCASMVSLRLSGCCAFDMGVTTIHWPSLKTLCLDMVVSEKGKIMNILSRCPVLESLRLSSLLTRCNGGDRNLRIHSGSLRELVMENDQSLSLDILAPNLLSLRFSGVSFLQRVSLNGATSFTEAELNLGYHSHRLNFYLGYHSYWLKFLLEQLQHVAKITLGSRCLEILSTAEPNGKSHRALRWRNIKVYTTLCRRDLLGMAYLLQSSPLLESLVICNRDYDNSSSTELYLEFHGFVEKEFWLSQRKLYCVAKHLKRVEIIGFKLDNEKSKLLSALAKFLLEKAVGLTKMIIEVELRMSCGGAPNELHDLGDFPNVIQLQEVCGIGSRNAEVVINYRLNRFSYESWKHEQEIKSTRYTSGFRKKGSFGLDMKLLFSFCATFLIFFGS